MKMDKITKRGYDFYECLSAMQKSIRRKLEYDAMYWAVEVESFNPKTLWNRLTIIASEDIGLACPLVPLLIDVLARQYFDCHRRKKYSEARLFLSNAILLLAWSPKSRMVDDFLLTVLGEIEFEHKNLPMPDWALDKHTRKGREMGRGENHFIEQTKLVNESTTIENIYKKRAERVRRKYGEP